MIMVVNRLSVLVSGFGAVSVSSIQPYKAINDHVNDINDSCDAVKLTYWSGMQKFNQPDYIHLRCLPFGT